MRVLVVDDNEMVRTVISSMLTNAGYDVITAADGQEALDLLKKGEARLVVSDWLMPVMTGMELCETVRRNWMPGYIYIVLVTAHEGTQHRVDGLQAGADDFISKPFSAGELLARVRTGERILKADRAELQAEIAHRRRVEKELTERRQELERANTDLALSNRRLAALYQTAQRFVDNVSHEFRTPLTVIKGYAEAVGEGMAGPVNVRQKEFLGFVVDRTRDLAQMVDDLLDSSKLRAGTLRIDRAPHVLEAIVAPVRPLLQAKAAGNHIEIVEEFEPNLPEVFVDVEKASRIVVNLAINAIKFSPENSRVVIWARPHAEGGVEIGVTDHGPGISPENLELIFDRFKQLGDAQSAITKGFGLGLNIARELAALNLGELHVASVTGHGSTFSLTLPPNDPEVVLRRYLAYLRMLPDVEPMIGLLRIGHLGGEVVSEHLHKFIASTIRPTDLILLTQDQTALLVMGATSGVGRWADRLRRAAEAFKTRLNPHHALGDVEFQAVDEWPYPAAVESAEHEMVKQLKGEPAYA